MISETSAVSALAGGDSRLEDILQAAAELAIPVIVLGEYRYGISQSRHRRRYEAWLKGLLASCRVLLIDEATSEEYASVRAT